MNQDKINGRAEEKKPVSYAEIAAIMNEELTDDNLKELLFEMTTIRPSGITGIGVIYKMLMFSFIFALSKYRADKRNGRDVESTPNARRAMETMDCLYNGEDMSLDIIIYVLTEMQLDVASADKRAYFDGIFSRDDDAIQIPVFRSVIKTWLSSADYAESNERVLAGYLFGLYKAIPALKDIELRIKDRSIVDDQEITVYDFYYKPTKELIPGALLFKDIDGEFYYLESFEFSHGSKTKLVYSTLNSKHQHVVEVERSAAFQEAAMEKVIKGPRSVFAKALYALDFKYIKNLALAVSDVITTETKRKINAHFSVKYNDVFELGYKQFNEINWDNVMTILMFEEGPSNMLEFILDSDGFCFEKILRNLAIRYNDKDFAKRARRFYTEEQAKEMDALRNHIEVNSSYVKNIIEINKILMAKAIVNELASLEKRQKVSNACFVESLPMRIKNLNETMNSEESIFGKVLAVNRTLEKTFRYVLPFYVGLIAFVKRKNELISEMQCRNLTDEEMDGERKNVYARCEEAFMQAAAEKAAELSKKSLGGLIEDFRAFGMSFRKKKGGGHVDEITENGRIVKEAVGRSYFCSVDTFNSILKIDTTGMMSDYAKKEYNLVSYINDVKHSKKGGAVANVVLFSNFLLQAKKLLYFLTYNEDYMREMLLGQQISFDPVYPYVVQYEERSERRDCCDINSFSVYLTEDNGKREIKILSDREYVINEKYYCIPNVTTSNSRWWIEPFLINCREYDQLIVDAMEGKVREEDR